MADIIIVSLYVLINKSLKVAIIDNAIIIDSVDLLISLKYLCVIILFNMISNV